MDINLALHAAIAAADTENLDRLLHDPDVDINSKNAKGNTPLMASMRKGFGSTMAKSIIAAGCDVNGEDQHGYTPLHKAVKNNLIDVGHELILRGAFIDKQIRYHNAPLSKAIVKRNLDAICLLVYHQADVNTPISIWGTPLIQAVDSQNNVISKRLLDFCDDNSVLYEDRSGKTALSIALDQKNPIAVDLIRRGASVNCIACGPTALHYALFYQECELFKLILPEYEYRLCLNLVPFLHWYIDHCDFSNFEWLECFYLILNNPVASAFIREYEDYGCKFSILFKIMGGLACKNIELKDRVSIIYICLSLGAEIKADDLQSTHLFFGSNDEYEAVVYAGELSYNDYKEQMRLLFKEPFNSTIPVDMYDEFSDSQYSILSKKSFCSLGLFALSPEKRKRYLAWIESDMPEKRKVILEELKKIPQFPSLLELSRDQAQKFIEDNFNIIKVYQFFDVVGSLSLPQFVKDMILFKRRIY